MDMIKTLVLRQGGKSSGLAKQAAVQQSQERNIQSIIGQFSTLEQRPRVGRSSGSEHVGQERSRALILGGWAEDQKSKGCS